MRTSLFPFLRFLLVVTLVHAAITLAPMPGFSPPSASAATCWRPPVDGAIIDPFREPPCPYCAGNRGIEYRVAAGTTIRSVASGVVSWSGSVAGVRYVVVRDGGGRRVTYGRLDSTSLRTGDRVLAGTAVGTAGGSFHLGLRSRAGRYIDPEPYLGRWVRRPRLVPLDGTPAHPAPPASLRCDRDVVVVQRFAPR